MSNTADHLDARDFPTLDAYLKARRAALIRARILSLREHNRHLSIAQIADYAGVPAAFVRDVLALPRDFPGGSAPPSAMPWGLPAGAHTPGAGPGGV